MTTLHQAKGLEYPVVFIMGVEEGLLPHANSTRPERLNEERRLFYVGVTRAMDLLHITYSARRTTARTSRPSKPSRFLTELPAELLEAV